MNAPSRTTTNADRGTPAEPVDTARLELVVGGMTCASCAARVERRLNRIDGVAATVNYATEKATVTAPAGLDPGELVAAVAGAGYTATVTAQPPAPRAAPDSAGPENTRPAGPTAAGAIEADTATGSAAGTTTGSAADDSPGAAVTAAARHRLLVSAALSLPVIVLAMACLAFFTPCFPSRT